MQVHSHYVCIHGYDVVVRASSLEKSGIDVTQAVGVTPLVCTTW